MVDGLEIRTHLYQGKEFRSTKKGLNCLQVTVVLLFSFAEVRKSSNHKHMGSTGIDRKCKAYTSMSGVE